MSRASLPSVAVSMPSVTAMSHNRSRSVCHGRSGTSRASSRAQRLRRPRAPDRRSEASVPAAPPNCSASVVRASRGEHGRDDDRARSTTAASLTPSVTGSACCSHVRPAHHRAGVAPRPASPTRCVESRDIGIDQREGVAQLQHEAGVDRRPGSSRPSARNPSRRHRRRRRCASARRRAESRDCRRVRIGAADRFDVVVARRRIASR